MGTSFERFVRPFQTPVTLAQIPVVVVPISSGDPDPILMFGAAGTPPTPLEVGEGFVVKNTQTFSETKRASDTVRVFHKDPTSGAIDQSQSVDVERVKGMQFTTSPPSAPAATTATAYTPYSALTGSPMDPSTDPSTVASTATAPQDGAATMIFTNPAPADNEQVINVGPDLPADPSTGAAGTTPAGGVVP
jgi:hypothetical protein